MTDFSFSASDRLDGAKVLVALTNSDLSLPAVLTDIDPAVQPALARAMAAAAFKGKAQSKVDILAPQGLAVDRVLILGLPEEDEEAEWMLLGGAIANALLSAKATMATVLLQGPEGALRAEQAGAIAAGAKLGAYRFDTYKSKKDEDSGESGLESLRFISADAGAEAAFAVLGAVAEGTLLARTLVNEPANVLTTERFAQYARDLSALGVEVEVLGEAEMAKLGMRSLLAVGQGSDAESLMAIMRWNGGNEGDAPLAFVGKGVVFDTGGISIKPAGGMEDMKGDMGGAAAVTGLMHAVAARKAKANVVGVIGLVENMPSAKAQRPGDIVEAMSGTTIEVLNTDAEGRMVLADALWYTQERFKPQFMINLATLTGACVVALAHEYAGLFSNDDELAERLHAAGTVSRERVWRLPLSKEYDKMIESKVADIKNTGGRWGGAITAAQFLQHFVNETKWAHIDVAGVAMGSPQTAINKGWTSGFGVRLLNQLIVDHYEGK